jgi:hypothetical protein
MRKLIENILTTLLVVPNIIFIIIFAIEMNIKGLSDNDGEDFIYKNRKLFVIVAIIFYSLITFYFLKPLIRN